MGGAPPIYHTFSCALGSYGPSRVADLTVALGLPSWAPNWTCAAQLGCQGALERQVGLPRCTWTPFWAPTWRPSASPECPGAPRTLNFARRYGTLATFSKIGFCAPQVLLDCLLAALGAFLGAFWAQLGASWAPLGLNLGSLGRLWGSSWGLLGASWASLGPLGRLLGQLGASWAPIGRQLGTKWTPYGRHMNAKWA